MNLNDNFVRRYITKEKGIVLKVPTYVRYLFNFGTYLLLLIRLFKKPSRSATIRYLPNLFQIKDARRQNKEILSKSLLFRRKKNSNDHLKYSVAVCQQSLTWHFSTHQSNLQEVTLFRTFLQRSETFRKIDKMKTYTSTGSQKIEVHE